MSDAPANAEPEYLGFWARFVAFLIDSTAATIIMAPLAARVMGELNLADYDLTDPVQQTELLVRLSSQLGFDLLVMGTVARSGVKGLVIGNTAEKILDHVDCSVLTLKPPGWKTTVKGIL